MSNETILFYLTFLKSINQRNYQIRQYEARFKNVSQHYCDQGELIAVLMERYSQLGDEMISCLNDFRRHQKEWDQKQKTLQQDLKKVLLKGKG